MTVNKLPLIDLKNIKSPIGPKALLVLLLLITVGQEMLFTVFVPWVNLGWVYLLLLMLYSGLVRWFSLTFPKNYSFLVDLPSTDDKLPKVSIVIPAHNEASVLEKTVRSALVQNYPDFELLVMDDRSTDNTIDVLTNLQGQIEKEFKGEKKFTFHTRPQTATPGKSAVLNDSLGLTNGKLILVLDADARINEQFLAQLVPYFKDESLAAVQVVKTIENETQNWLTQAQQVEYVLDVSLQNARDRLKTACELRGNGQLVRRKAVMEVGGWTEYSVTDDLDLSSKFHATGWQIRFCNQTQVLEEGLTNLRALYKQRLRWAKGSMRRYLDYALPLAFSSETRASIKWESLGYASTFLLPVVAAFDLIFITVEPIKIIAWFVMWGALILSLVVIFNIELIRAGYKANLSTSIKAVITALYMVLVWPVTVVQATLSLLIRSTHAPLQWDKTVRSVDILLTNS